MAFDEVQFPSDISYGSRGGPGFRTDVIQVDSGAEERTGRWSGAMRQYNAGYGVKSPDQLNTLITFYLLRKGAQYGFRYKDWLDFTSAINHRNAPAATDQEIGIGDGTTTQFQLKKTYSSGRTMLRNITKPVAATVLLALDGTPTGSGWSVDTTTGIITFVSAPSADVVITAGFEFDTPVRFGQSADVVLQMSWDDFGSGSIPDIPLQEIRDQLEVNDDFFMGGANEAAISAHKQLALADGRVQVFNPSADSLNLLLPDKANVQPGGPIFYLVNEGAHDLTVKDGVTTVGTLVAGTACEVILSINLSSTKVWYLL